MNTNPSNNTKWKQFVAYPVHFSIRLVARFLLLVAILTTAILPPLILIFIHAEIEINSTWIVRQIKENNIFQIISLFTSIGLFSSLLKRYGKIIWESLLNIGR